MKTIPFEELSPEQQAKWGPSIERLRQKERFDLPPAPAGAAEERPAPPRAFRAHYLASLGEEVFVTHADLNDGLFIAEHTPTTDPGNIHGYVLQVMRVVFRVPEHRPENRRFRMDREQDDRPYVRETLAWEELIDLLALSASLGRRREYVSEGLRAFLSEVQTCLSDLSGALSTSTDCPPSLKTNLARLSSAASQLASPTSSASGTVSDGAE